MVSKGNAQVHGDGLMCELMSILRHNAYTLQAIPHALHCRPEDKKFFKQQGVVFGVGEATNTSLRNRVARQHVTGGLACSLPLKYDMKEFLQLRGVMAKYEAAQGTQHSFRVRNLTSATSAPCEVVDLKAGNVSKSAASGLIDLTG